MKPSNNIENKSLSDIYWRVQLERMTVQAHSFLEPPLEYFWKIKVWYDVFNQVVLLSYPSLAAPRTILQWLLASLNFNLDSKSLYCYDKRKKWFLWIMGATRGTENNEDE